MRRGANMTNKINRPVSDTKKSLSSSLKYFLQILCLINSIFKQLFSIASYLVHLYFIIELIIDLPLCKKLIDILTWYTSASYPTKQPDSKSNYD